MKLKSFKEFINENFGNFFKNTNLNLKLKYEIEEWCKKMNIKNFEIVEDKEYIYVINVNGNINLSNKNLVKIPYKFGIVKGNFIITNNNLETLENCPDECKWFNCSYNLNLKSLIGGPKEVDSYNCNNCKLKTLNGAPLKCNMFNCSNNSDLKSLNGGPEIVSIEYNCSNCNLETLNGAPKKFIRIFNCSGNKNLKNLIGGPKKVEEYDCSNCSLESLEGAPEECKTFACYNNKVVFTEEEVRKYIKNVKEIITKKLTKLFKF